MSVDCDICHGFKYSVAGIPCAQYWCDLALWEMVLNSHTNLRAIVEIGTWKGGMAWYLWMQAQARGIDFLTVDIVEPDAVVPCYEQLDVFRYADEFGRRIGAMGPIALFCDGGNKPRELKTFPPYLHEGSIVFVHDWGTETLRSDVPPFLEEMYGDYCDQIGSITRVFRMRPSEGDS